METFKQRAAAETIPGRAYVLALHAHKAGEITKKELKAYGDAL